MASKIIAFSPTPLPTNHHSIPSGNSIKPFSVVFPSTRNPTTLPGVRAHSTGDNTSLNVRVTSNQGTMEPRLPRRRWALDASPLGKSSTDQKWEEEGLITESLPNGNFRVKLDNGDMILGYLSGKLRQRFIRVIPGDRVKIEFSRYDMTKARITYRLRNKDRIIETEE